MTNRESVVEQDSRVSAASRRLSIALRLSSGRTFRVDEIAEEFRCSRRTVFRDLQHIREQPYLKVARDPVTFELYGSHDASHDGSGCLRTSGQRIAAAVALAVTRVHAYGISPAQAELAIHSIRKACDADSRANLDRLLTVLEPIRSKANHWPTSGDRIAAQLVSCACQDRTIEVAHKAGKRTVTTQLRPESLDVVRNCFVVRGYSVLADKTVTIDLANIVDVTPVDASSLEAADD